MLAPRPGRVSEVSRRPLVMEFDADVERVAPEQFVAEAITRSERAVPLGEDSRCGARHLAGVDVAIDLVAGPNHVVPHEQRVAEPQADVLAEIDAEVEAELRHDAEHGPA